MKKILPLLILLTACSSGEVVIDENPEIVEEQEVEEVEIEDTAPLCENGRDWSEVADEMRELRLPDEELYARKVYEMEGLGLKFEIPGQSSEYHAFTSSERDRAGVDFGRTTEPGCMGYGDAMDPYLAEIGEFSAELPYLERLEDASFAGIDMKVFSEEYLGQSEIIFYEFELEGRFYRAEYLWKENDPQAEAAEALITGVLETLEKY